MTARPHVVIIGAGIVGAAVAYRMTQGGARVTVVDAGKPAAMASGASFGWINASYFANPDHFHLRHAAIAAHHRLDADLGGSGVQWQGALWFEDTGAALDRQAEVLRALGYPVAELTTAEFRAREPHLANPPRRALAFPAEGAVDAVALTQRLLQTAALGGANIRIGEAVLAFRIKAGRVTGVCLAQGDIDCDQVIIAAGTATQSLLSTLGITLPMLQRPGVIVQTRPAAPMIRHVLVGPQGEIRQDALGRIITPAAVAHQGDATETITETQQQSAKSALRRLQTFFPGADLHIDRVACAYRPVPKDGLPAIGAIGPMGLYVAVMHSGVTLAALTGDLVAAEVLHGQSAPLLAPFRPDRSFQ